jgi:hypothetical protein
MSWLDFLQTKKECSINFGRGIYAEIAKDEEELFNQASEAFEKREIFDGYEYFLRSLINYTKDISNENIHIKRDNESLTFTLFQGSAKVKGIITKEYLSAEVTLVKKEFAPVALKRKILERNYQFTYINYISDAEFIKLKLYQDNITLNPQKIFFPLRELSLNADFDKDFIKSEFPNVTLEEVEHLQSLSHEELQIKYTFLMQWIEELHTKVPTLPANDNAGMQAFLYLNILFKIDYLLVPKYTISQKLSKKIQAYFSDENATIEAKNEELKRHLLKIQALTFEEFKENFYNAKYTFNPIEKSSYEEFCNFISESLLKIRWYKNNRYMLIVPTIYSYMAFYSLYNYGLNNALKELLYLYVNIINTEFFATLGCPTFYDTKKESFAKRTIMQSIDEVITKHQEKYKDLESFSDELNFNSQNEFANSFYQAIKNLDFEEL